jgi:hypothetical protein
MSRWAAAGRPNILLRGGREQLPKPATVYVVLIQDPDGYYRVGNLQPFDSKREARQRLERIRRGY